MRLALSCPAKLNWTLAVRGRRRDGFHELDSWFVAVGLFDTLTLSLGNDGPALQVDGAHAEAVPVDGRNLILHAEETWRAAGGEAPQGTWHIHKRIPAAAGLGGGSSDAAGALRLLQEVATVKPTKSLEALALSLGSDIPFFLQRYSACRMGGRGELLLQAIDPPPAFVVLAIPGIPVPTADVFSRLQAPPLSSVGSVEDSPFPMVPGTNDLLPAALVSVPALADFSDALAEVAEFHLSGSGGTFFHFAQDEASAAATAARIEVVCKEVRVVPLLSGPPLSNPSSENGR
ncbi:MAG: 4-(cytidine 5'-diphospho)-2-C-methyl-D-erythritol kinase [Planctomycetota bacterium]|jgi:4-diphosphocytidyl-2-C-methyl-D-erythritol kinase